MRVIADLHLHSKWSRACSKQLTIPNIAKACERKGVNLVGTSDVTHPAWFEEIHRELEEVAPGTFVLKDHSSLTRFILSTEISCIYKRGGKTRRVHHILLFSSLNGAARFIQALTDRGCNLKSDGRPIIGLDSEELLKLLFDADEHGLLIPAHAWTPWFAIFGSQSGFDTMEECFGDMTKYIPAIETGLSSDPAMNRRWSYLDDVLLVSNSDAHSLDNIGREANVFEMDEPRYQEVRRILVEKDRKKFLETIEFFPEKGKYHADGHRACKFWCEPKETTRIKGVCPTCGKPLTIGVWSRVEALADRESPGIIPDMVPFRSIVPLRELIGEVLDVGAQSKRVAKETDALLAHHAEFEVLLDLPREQLLKMTSPEITEAICTTREGNISIRPGYDGEYGAISFGTGKQGFSRPKQTTLF